MEIALNLMQPMGTEPMAATAGGTGLPVTPVTDGAFALFFAQMISSTMPALSPQTNQTDADVEMTDAQKEESPVQEKELLKEEPVVVKADLTPELQSLALLQLAQPIVPVAPLPQTATAEETTVEVEAVSIKVVPETKPDGSISPVSLPPASAASNTPVDRTAIDTASLKAPAPPVAEVAAPMPKENVPVETPAAPPLKEARIVPKEVTPASPIRESEMPSKVSMTSVSTPEPAAEKKPLPENPVVETPSGSEGTTLRKSAAAETRRIDPAPFDPAPVVDETGEAPVSNEENPVRIAVREADISDSMGQDQQGQQEQHFASQGKEHFTSPATVSTQAPREAEPVRHVQTSAMAENTPAPEHEHIMLQVKEKLAVHSYKGGNDQISFTLHPEELGELKIMMRMDDQRLKVEIITQNQTVREALMQNLEGLKESLSRQSITVDRFDVSTGGGSFNQAFREGRHAGRDRNFQPYHQSAGGVKEPDQKTIVTGWLPRENSLVDVRF